MKAVIWNTYGPPEKLIIKDIPRPDPKEDEVLIQIHASTVTLGDCEMRSLDFIFTISLMLRLYFGVFNPGERVLGQELSGQVVKVGSNVRRFKVGDRVIATPGMKLGTYAQYTCIKENRSEGVLVKIPDSVGYKEGAALPVGGLEALNFVGNSHLKKGETILINGAGGSIGTMAIQLAKNQGAYVVAVDRQDKLDFLKAVGADEVIDYQKEDFTLGQDSYDVILDVVGKAHFWRSLKSLNKGGRYMIANPSMSLLLKKTLASIRKNFIRQDAHKKIYMKMTNQSNDDMIKIIEMLKTGSIKVFIDKVYRLDTITDAHHYVEGGHKKGNVVIDIEQSGDQNV
ncbi:NAD(P)-dependent alcohol dehydrogenase [Fusibacter sp. JL216-2]|uniref:NAD(P)-dependent alcohol dehydrogenase n=1 Tax=Fusibacter sp. JL216-2 TaxID=3071453 RepID=UPI003D3292C3